MQSPRFPQTTLPFLRRLAQNNNRNWFNEHKGEYESSIREPALALVEAMEQRLPQFAPLFRAIAKKSGGSLMRVYRDTRFSKDKTPYKTNIGIQFRHELGRDVHAPGYYLHIEPDKCFLGVGIWHPESKVLNKIRNFIADTPSAWRDARDYPPFTANYELVGESLVRPPRGFSADHPLISDLKRKDFIALHPFDGQRIQRTDLLEWMVEQYECAEPLISYLCEAVEVPY